MEKQNNDETKIRVLNVVPNMRAAGIESFIMNLYRNIDKNKIQFDFLVHSSNKEFYDDEIDSLGGKIYRLSYKDDKNLFKYIVDLINFFNNHPEYKIIHGHMQSMMPLYLLIAKIKGIPIRIAHSHNNSYEKSAKGIILHLFSRFAKFFSNVNYACSTLAGNYLFKNKKFDVIYNGIDISKYRENRKIRTEIRRRLDIENKYVVGFIGRLEKQKNPFFTIKIFEKILEKEKNSILLMFGDGSLKEKLKKYILNRGLKDKIIMMGEKHHIEEYINTFDVFLLPSLYEGLGIVLIENQYMNKKVYTTKDVVPKETQISNLINYVDLKQSAEYWANTILKDKNENVEQIIYNDNFDIRNVSKNMENRYIELISAL